MYFATSFWETVEVLSSNLSTNSAQLKLFSPRSTYTVRFENIGGLEKGDPIVVRGMEQGQVDRVRLKDDFVEVRFWLDQSVRLQSNFTVLIESREIIG